MKKIAFTLLLTSTLLLAGCGTIGGGEEEYHDNTKLKIRFHVDAKSAEGKAYKILVDNFNNAYSEKGYKVTAAFVARSAGDQGYEDQLRRDMENGELPDIITFDAPNCAAYADSGYLYDITNLLTQEEKDKYITLNKYKDHIYGVPIQESSAGFYYNKALFNRAGINVSNISVDNPWTYNEFKDACQKLANTGVRPVDMRMDATKDETATYLLYPFIYASGGSFVDDTGLKALGYFNSTGSKRGFQFLKDLVSAGYTGYDIGATDFFTGQVGMYLSSGWTIPDLDNRYPQTFPNRDSWGLLPYPKDVTTASANGSWSYAVGNNPRKDKSAVMELLKYISNGPSSKILTNATGMIPANKDTETNYSAGSPEDVLYQQLQKTGKNRPETIGYPSFSQRFRMVIDELRSGDVNSIVDSKAALLEKDLKQIS